MRYYRKGHRLLAIGLAMLAGFVDALGFLKLKGVDRQRKWDLASGQATTYDAWEKAGMTGSRSAPIGTPA
ncbi:hypothetical protein [Sphingomonas oryzagri]